MYINENVYQNSDKEGTLKLKYKDNYYYTTFDLKNYIKILKYHWRLSKKKNKFYVCTGQNKNGNKIIYMQNLIMNFIPDNIHEIDHIDGESLNNKEENFRLIKRIDNIHNSCVRDDNETINVRGISFDSRFNKYTVDFHYNKKRYYFKHFKKVESAIYLRYLCELEFLKEFRHTSNDNFINDYINLLTNTEKENIEAYFLSKIN